MAGYPAGPARPHSSPPPRRLASPPHTHLQLLPSHGGQQQVLGQAAVAQGHARHNVVAHNLQEGASRNFTQGDII